jgi:hypothetical protein
MRFRKLTNALYYTALWSNIAAGSMVVILGGIRNADVDTLQAKLGITQGFADLLVSLKDSAWMTLPILAILSGLLALILKMVGPPWLWNVVHVILDQLRNSALQFNPQDPIHYHRVTLFKRVQWLWCRKFWPWDGWLVAVERSGHTTRNRVSFFRAPDEADKAEGIAGRVWASDATFKTENLPDISEVSPEADVKVYADRANISVETVRKRLPKARSIGGFPIEVKGKRWGVLILDSRNPQAITELGEAMLTPMGKTLSKLLEKL